MHFGVLKINADLPVHNWSMTHCSQLSAGLLIYSAFGGHQMTQEHQLHQTKHYYWSTLMEVQRRVQLQVPGACERRVEALWMIPGWSYHRQSALENRRK